MIWPEIVIILIVIVKTANAVMIVNAVKTARNVAAGINAKAMKNVIVTRSAIVKSIQSINVAVIINRG